MGRRQIILCVTAVLAILQSVTAPPPSDQPSLAPISEEEFVDSGKSLIAIFDMDGTVMRRYGLITRPGKKECPDGCFFLRDNEDGKTHQVAVLRNFFVKFLNTIATKSMLVIYTANPFPVANDIYAALKKILPKEFDFRVYCASQMAGKNNRIKVLNRAVHVNLRSKAVIFEDDWGYYGEEDQGNIISLPFMTVERTIKDGNTTIKLDDEVTENQFEQLGVFFETNVFNRENINITEILDRDDHVYTANWKSQGNIDKDDLPLKYEALNTNPITPDDLKNKRLILATELLETFLYLVPKSKLPGFQCPIEIETKDGGKECLFFREGIKPFVNYIKENFFVIVYTSMDKVRGEVVRQQLEMHCGLEQNSFQWRYDEYTDRTKRFFSSMDLRVYDYEIKNLTYIMKEELLEITVVLETRSQFYSCHPKQSRNLVVIPKMVVKIEKNVESDLGSDGSLECKNSTIARVEVDNQLEQLQMFCENQIFSQISLSLSPATVLHSVLKLRSHAYTKPIGQPVITRAMLDGQNSTATTTTQDEALNTTMATAAHAEGPFATTSTIAQAEGPLTTTVTSAEQSV